MKKRTKKELDQIFGFMMEKFPDADTELIYHNGFQLLVAVILSAQTTDKQVNKVTDKLWTKIKKPEDILALGLYRSKAKHIRATSQILAQN